MWRPELAAERAKRSTEQELATEQTRLGRAWENTWTERAERFAKGLAHARSRTSPFADHYVPFLDGFARAATARRSHGARHARGPSASNLRKTTL
jgi:hypothetical protein